MTEKAVLLFLRDGGQILLIHKKRGLGTGKINAPGGRVEAGEDWPQAVRRETREETGLEVETIVPIASLFFQFVDGYALDVRVFEGNGWSGTLTACDEADPFWTSERTIPWERMWADDPIWYSRCLEGRFTEGRFLFDKDRMVEARWTVKRRN